MPKSMLSDSLKTAKFNIIDYLRMGITKDF